MAHLWNENGFGTKEGDVGMNWLEGFANSVEARGDDPDADLALEWITAWENCPEYVEELKRQKEGL